MSINHLSDSSFDREVLQPGSVVLVDFWAPWCAPCKMLAPILDELSQEYDDKLKVCKLNVDENQKIVARYQILSVPTLLFFKQGKVVQQIVGTRSKSDIKKVIEAVRSN